MITVRKSAERAHYNYGWLDTRHTFSFNEYYDPSYVGFRSMRVLNEDRIQGGTGFEEHSHKDMEIVTYVIEGALKHQDSTGFNTVIRAGELQRMSAGRGITHSEYNESKTEHAHFLQIWIIPDRQGLEPSYAQHATLSKIKHGRWELCAAPGGSKYENALVIHQNVSLWYARLKAREHLMYRICPKRCVWIQVVRGGIGFNKLFLEAGDGAAIYAEDRLDIQSGREDSELLLFDLA